MGPLAFSTRYCGSRAELMSGEDSSMRVASKLNLVVVLSVLLTCVPTLAQEPSHADGDRVTRNGYSEIYGPTYSKSDFESLRILGISYGMLWNDAEKTIREQGFINTPNPKFSFMKLGEAGRYEFISLKVRRLGGLRKRVVGISYWRNKRLNTEEAREASRDEFSSAFGRPTAWMSPQRGTDLVESMHWLTPNSIRDNQKRYEARVCGFSWQCDFVLYEKDCRPLVKDVHGIALEIVVLHSVDAVEYQLYDMDIELDEARSSKSFWEMDVRDAVCAIPSVH
jgi:hypothetical protein